MTTCRDVDACMQQFTCKHARTHTLRLSVTVNTLIIDASFLFFGLLFNGLCFSSTFKSRNHCSHFHIKIPPPRDMLLCGRLVAWLMSKGAHPHKCKSKHTLNVSDSSCRHPYSPARHWMPLCACTLKHTHVNPIRHFREAEAGTHI